MASGSSYIINISNYTCSFSVTNAYEHDVNIANNTSYLHLDFNCVSTLPSGYTYSGSTRSNGGYVGIRVDGTRVGGMTVPVPNGMYSGQTLGSSSVDVLLTHNTDGSRSATYGITMDQGGGNYSGDGYVWAGTGWSDSSITLSTIPRASQPSLNTGSIECNDVNAFIIYTNRASSSFTHNITYQFGSASGPIATGVGDSVSWTPLTSLLNQIPNATSGSGTIYCETYSGSTKIGSTTSVGFTLTCNTATPTISASVEELNTLVGTSANYTLIGVSNKKITATVSTKYGSTVGSVVLTVLGTNYTMSGSGNTYTYTLNSSQSGTYKVTITDSRGLTNSTTITQTEYKYITPYASSTDFKRTAPTANTGTLTVKGSWFSGLSNALTATTTLRNTKSSTETTIAATLTTSGDTWTVYAGTSILNSLTYTDAFIATITLTDKFKTVTITANLASAQYALWVGKNTVRVKGALIVNGNFVLDSHNYVNIIYPVGSIYISNSSTSPASLFGGTWTQIAQGRTLIGQGTGYAVNATGGSETVSLTAEQNGPHAHPINEQYLHGGANGDFANSHDGGSLNGWDYSPSSVNQGARRMTIPATSTNSSGSGSAHNNMMPYLVEYMWQRIA